MAGDELAPACERARDSSEDVGFGNLSHAVAAIGVASHAGCGRSGAEAGARKRSLEHSVALAERAPDRNVLRAEERDDRSADRRGDVHRAAVVAEKDVELRGERGKFSDRQWALDCDEVGFRVGADLLHERLLGGAGDQEDLRAEFVLQAIADGGETLGRPDAKGGTAAGVEEDS